MTKSTEVSLEKKIHFLKQPQHYPEKTTEITIKETHMSMVFLTDKFVYKLKKPVRYDYLDFSSVELRYQNCKNELYLNQRLADDVYLKIVPLTLDDSGQLSFSEKGVTVDWLVKMRRLPDSDMLDYQIMHHTVQPKKLYQFAVRLINFYQQATPVILTPEVYLYFFKNIIEENSKELIKKTYGLNAKQIKKLTHILENFLMTQKTLLDDRVLKHKIIEAHGDLKPEHVYLGPTPFIIDCLEFKREFRILDPLDELAFFAMECEKLNAGYIGDTLFKVYEEILEDQIPKNLVAFYKTHRAFLRARLVIRHLAEPQYQKDQDKWREKTKQYLELAEKYASDLINY